VSIVSFINYVSEKKTHHVADGVSRNFQQPSFCYIWFPYFTVSVIADANALEWPDAHVGLRGYMSITGACT